MEDYNSLENEQFLFSKVYSIIYIKYDEHKAK